MSEALNIVKASFGGLREVATAPLWQYDYGQILKITGLDLPQAFEVHFSNSRKSGETVTQIGTDSQVTIPDMYLTSGADIYAFIFLHDGLTDGETEYVIKIPVRERPEPSDIEPTPEQQDAITEAIAALNDAVTQTGEDKEATAALAEAAAASSLIATEAAQSAQGSATSASASASTASTAAATATQKAGEAAQSASEAESARASARNYAASASDSAGDADAAKTAAQSAAQTATSKAAEASTSATNASGSATAASASASQASESATSAANSATAASGSATSAATSASTATTKASEASASATAAQTAQTAAQAAQAAAETAQTAAEAARDETVAEAASIRGLLKDKADVIYCTAEGAIATFNDGGDDMPMMSCVAMIEPVQSGSGDPSPENVRPITGWTGCSVNVAGKNLLNIDRQVDVPNPTDLTVSPRVMNDSSMYVGISRGNYYYNGNVNSYSIENGTITVNSKNNSYGLGFPVSIKPSTTYTLSATKTACLMSVGQYDAEWNFINSIFVTSDFSQTFTTADNASYIVVIISSQTVNTDGTATDIQLELGSTATDYEPFVGHVYPISWQSEAGTVYGGTLDVVSGVLTVDKASIVLNGSQLIGLTNWRMFDGASSWLYARNTVPNIKVLDDPYVNIICDKLNTVPYSSSYNGIYGNVIGIATVPGSNNAWSLAIRVPVEGLTTNSSIQAWLAENPLTVVYKLATPQTYQLTPVEVKTLLGLNNVWVDTGDVEVQYRADTKLYIDGKNTDFSKLIAPTEADYKATMAYTSGSLLIVGSQLYKASTAIANGATLTVGTNITATTLAEVIAAL